VSAESERSPAHPAPDRHKARFGALVVGLAAAPVGWALQTIIGYSLVSASCYPGAAPLRMPVHPDLRGVLVALNLVALAIGLVGHGVAYRSWSATRTERDGSAAHLLEVGEGRTRFLAMCGRLVSLGFLVATLFTSVSLLLSPLCR
jgi:hypothetical protein